MCTLTVFFIINLFIMNDLFIILGGLKFTTRDFKITTPFSLVDKSELIAKKSTENLPTITTTETSLEGDSDENTITEDDIVLLTTLESVNDDLNTVVDNTKENTERNIPLRTTPRLIDTNENKILYIRKQEATTPNSLKKYTQWFNNVNKLLFTSPNGNQDKNTSNEENTEIQITTSPTVIQITTIDSSNDVVFTSTTTTTTQKPPTTSQTTTTSTTTTEKQGGGLGDIALNLATQGNNFFNSVFKTIFGF